MRYYLITIVTTLLFVVRATGKTVAELQAENDLLHIRANVNFLSSLIIICVIMIFFMWGIRERNRKHLMLLQRKNNALKRSNKQLDEARAIAERASRVKSLFIDNMSHEIRTPLHQMFGFLQLLADDSTELDDASREEMMKYVFEGCQQLTKVVENITEVADKLDKMEKLSDVESVLKKKQEDAS